MKIVVNDRQGLLSQNAIQKAKSKAIASFAKFGQTVKSIEITVQDVNGPRGGLDKHCLVLVKLLKMRDVSTSADDVTLSKAIPAAVDRAARSVKRSIGRRAVRTGSRLLRVY